MPAEPIADPPYPPSPLTPIGSRKQIERAMAKLARFLESIQ